MPEECASMRSIARWVLPVLVGPSTAVTPTPRARASRLWGAEKETGISGERPVSQFAQGFCTTMRRRGGSVLRDRTSLERIAAESLTRPVSEFVHPDIWRPRSSTPLGQVTLKDSCLAGRERSVNAADDHNFPRESTRRPTWPQASLRFRLLPTPCRIRWK